jgi:phage baseplate assembly protein gpV
LVVCTVFEVRGLYSQPAPPSFDDAAVIGMTADDGVELVYDPSASELTVGSPLSKGVTKASAPNSPTVGGSYGRSLSLLLSGRLRGDFPPELFQAAGLAHFVAQVVELCAADLAPSQHFDFTDGRAIEWKYALHAHARADLANGE